MKVTKVVVILSSVGALLFCLAFSEAQEKKTAGSPGMSGACQILTPTDGVDFSNHVYDLMVRMKRNWYAVMPEDARLGKKGRVAVRFQIQKDQGMDEFEGEAEARSRWRRS